MHDHETQEPSEESIAKGYEQEDISLPMIFKAAKYLVVFTLIVSAIVAGIYFKFVPKHEARSGYTVSAGRQMDANVPLIQSEPMPDIQKLRTEEYVKENEYNYWTDDDQKKVLRIKLSRAMEIIKQRGVLPSAGPAPKMGSNSAPTAHAEGGSPYVPIPSAPITPSGGIAPMGTPTNPAPQHVDPATGGATSPQTAPTSGATAPSTPTTPSGQ